MAFGITPSSQTSRSVLTQLLHYHLPKLSPASLRVIKRRMRKSIAVCFVPEDADRRSTSSSSDGHNLRLAETEDRHRISALPLAEKRARKKLERFSYMIAAVMASFGITSMAVYSKFCWQMEGEEIRVTEMFGTFALSVGAAVGMEIWSRWDHKALWHNFLWRMHKSHHKPRVGQFELNDVFAIINSIAAIALLSYGFFHSGLVPGLCFGVGLGITMCGMAYVFVHDGLVHRRFPVGPIANVPYLRKVAAAHQELEEVGGSGELQKEIDRRVKL